MWTNYRTRLVLLPALLASGRRVERCSQLIVACTLHCSCAVCCLWCLGYVHCADFFFFFSFKKKKKDELCEARTHAIKSKIGHRDHLTILPNIHILIFRGAREARQTAHTRTAQQKREALMTDDGSQPPIEKLATAVHRGPATRSLCGPLLLVLLSGVVLLVFCAC